MTATIATRIRDRARRDPRGIAFREKSLGIWQETTWVQYGDLVERAAHGLLSLGLRPGDRVAIQCENRPEWLVAESAAIASRGVSVGLDPANAVPELDGPLRGAGARVAIVEDRQGVDQALAARAALPGLEWIVYLEPRGVRGDAEPSLVWWPDLLARGDEHRSERAGLLDELAERVSDDDPVTPALSAREVNLALATPLHPDPGPRDLVLCHLPLSQTAARLASAWLNADAGVQLHFGEPSTGLVQTLGEVEPSLFLATPAAWEQLRPVAATPTRPFHARALRKRLGLRKCRSAASISPLAPALADWYARLGVPVRAAEVV